MQLFFRGLSIKVLECQENETVAEIKALIADLEFLHVSEIKLYARGTLVSDDTLVCDLKDADIDISVGLPGGKVHGSLARAGKVRSQTPKVEKQEKKKKLTGRAKKRMLYNKRFNNSLPNFENGRPPGPNSNSFAP